jgi:hypothetical protein
VTLPEVVTGELAGKFGEISLYNQHADFEPESDSNSNGVPVGYRMRAGYRAIVCGLPTPRALPLRPLQRQQGPCEGSHCTC